MNSVWNSRTTVKRIHKHKLNLQMSILVGLLVERRRKKYENEVEILFRSASGSKTQWIVALAYKNIYV